MGTPFRVFPILAVGLLCFSFSPILVRFADEAPGLAVAVWRTVFAVILLAPIALPKIGDEVRQFSRREWALIITAGVLLGLHFVAWIESLYHTTVASASVLVTTSPIFIALLGFVFLHERLKRATVFGIGMGVAGAVLIGWGDAQGPAVASNPLLGNSLALGASFVFAIYLLIGRVVRQRYSWLAYVFPLYVVVALTALVMAMVLQTPLWGYDWVFFGLCVLMALGPSIAGHGSFNYAVRYLPAALLGLLGLMEPVLASLAAYALFDEVPTMMAIGGMVLVLIGVTVAMWPKKQRTGEHASRHAEAESDPEASPKTDDARAENNL